MMFIIVERHSAELGPASLNGYLPAFTGFLGCRCGASLADIELS